jgi:hypothetical protein
MVEIVTGAMIGYRLVKDAKFIMSIANYVKNYQGYNSEDNKQDDRAMRNWSMESTNGLRTHAVNLMEIGYRNDDDNLEREAKSMIDNLDLFKNEVNLASTKDAKSVWTKVSDADFASFVLARLTSVLKRSKLSIMLFASLSRLSSSFRYPVSIRFIACVLSPLVESIIQFRIALSSCLLSSELYPW